MTYLFATNNPGKVKEAQAVFEKTRLKLISLSCLGFFYEPAETGATFEENAIQKAAKTMEFLRKNGYNHIAVLADDSGLCIDALGGIPGVDSTNFMGRETPYDIRNNFLIEKLSGLQNRAAKFVCVIACVFPGGEIVTAEGVINGEIFHEPRGEGGFGYDPIFFIPEYNKTAAQLSVEEKNEISHRGKALKLMIRKLPL